LDDPCPRSWPAPAPQPVDYGPLLVMHEKAVELGRIDE
jgi:hypothetical protein